MFAFSRDKTSCTEWSVGIIAPEGRKRRVNEPPCSELVAVCPSSPVLGAFLTLHAASRLITGSPTTEVNREKFQSENEIRFGKAFGYLLQINRNY